MTTRNLVFAFGLAVASAGCSDPTSVVPDDLLGSWVVASPQQPQGILQQTLTFRQDGTVMFGVYHYGVYTPSTGLSAYSEIRGRYKVTGDRLDFDARTITIWDTFYDDPGPTTSSYPGTIFDNCTFEINGRELTLRYLSAPLDAPEPSVLRLNRKH